jgi:hypothetical protein
MLAVAMVDCASLAEELIDAADARAEIIARTLALFGAGALRFAKRHGVSVCALRSGERYRDRSPGLTRLGVDVDAWPAPPAGLFVVEERRVYLRSRSPMTVAHEFGHALDCALGGGVYRSGIDTSFRAIFSAARVFVTPYAATGIDEYFAEGLRAFVEANDPASHWPRATKARLREVDPMLFEYVERLFRAEFSQAA